MYGPLTEASLIAKDTGRPGAAEFFAVEQLGRNIRLSAERPTLDDDGGALSGLDGATFAFVDTAADAESPFAKLPDMPAIIAAGIPTQNTELSPDGEEVVLVPAPAAGRKFWAAVAYFDNSPEPTK